MPSVLVSMFAIICGFGEIMLRCGEKMKKNNFLLSYAYDVYAYDGISFLTMNSRFMRLSGGLSASYMVLFYRIV